MGKEQEEVERAIRSWCRSTTTRGEKEGRRTGQENLRSRNSSGTVWERLIWGPKDKDCPLKESCLVQEWPDSNIPTIRNHWPRAVWAKLALHKTHHASKGATIGSCQSIMLPTTGVPKEHSHGHMTRFVNRCWLSRKANMEWWGKPKMRSSRKLYHLRDPREAMVLVEARSWGHQAGSGNLTGSAWRALGRQREGLHESRAQSRESVTARDIYQNRKRGAFPLPSFFLAAYKASCGINIKGNYWQGTLRLLQG